MLEYQKKTRYLIIQGREKDTRWSYQNKVNVPEIRMSGIWLAKQGFFPKK